MDSSVYNYFRTYDPSTGRYLESDPVGLQGGLNTYGYAYQNPKSYIDPLGDTPSGLVLGLGNLAYQLYKNDGRIDCVKWGDVLMWGLGGVGAGVGGRMGLAATGKYFKGSNFSHMIPARVGKSFLLNNRFGNWLLRKGNPYNGQYVSRGRHYRHDPNYYGNVRGDRYRRLNEWGDRYSRPKQLADRVPPVYPYGAAGAGTGAATGAAAGKTLDSDGDDCSCAR